VVSGDESPQIDAKQLGQHKLSTIFVVATDGKPQLGALIKPIKKNAKTFEL
jgi:hypothetical protein